MLGFALLVLFSFSARAQDYTLYQAENDHYRAYSREELMQRLGEESSLLPNYACDGMNEWNFYWPALRHAEEQSSL